MTRYFELNGEWRLTGSDAEKSRTLSLPAHVPGQVHLDLLREGHIPDPFWRDQANDCQWVEHWDWTYEREFELPADFDRSWTVLECEGLDTFATIILNGQRIGSAANMLIPHAFEVGPRLRAGINHLQITFDSIWRHQAGKRRDYPCAFDNQERLHVRRMQCTFHWDWVHRFVTAGIWLPIRLVSHAGARIADMGVWTESLNSDDQTGVPATAELAVQLDFERRIKTPLLASLHIIDASGVSVCSESWPLDWPQGTGEMRQMRRLHLPSPRLWWPNGYGEQYLYTCKLTLSTNTGTTLDTREVTLGVRTVDVRQIPDQPGSPEAAMTQKLRRRFPDWDRNADRSGSSFKLFVNNTEIFCKGGNWVPADPFPARITPDWYDRLIRLAAEGNQNMLRCWGGGIYEPQPFWDACNRHGIMICQDFMMACAQYPQDDPEFMAAMARELPAAVRRLRNNPSLVWWYGDNENGCRFADDDPNCWCRQVYDRFAAPACRELDPRRPVFPTSPFGGNLNNSLTMGDSHRGYNPGHEEDFQGGMRDYREKIEEVCARFLSETQSYGAPAWTSLLKFMTAEDIADPANRILEFHSKTNPYAPMTLIAAQLRRAELLFGKTYDPQRKIAYLEYAQYEMVRLIVEKLRRDRFYCGGILFWMYNDCWPANGWSLVDYYGLPKAAWYAMKRAGAPLSLSIRDTGDTFEAWGANDTLATVTGGARIYVQPWQGAPHWETTLAEISLPANAAIKIAEIAKSDIRGLDKDAVLVCDLLHPTPNPVSPIANPPQKQPKTNNDEQRTKNEEQSTKNQEPNTHQASLAARGWYYPGLPHEMHPPPTALSLESCPGRELIISTDNYARVVTLEAENAVFTDNYFELLPGETRRITWRPATADGPVGTISVSCWNLVQAFARCQGR